MADFAFRPDKTSKRSADGGGFEPNEAGKHLIETSRQYPHYGYRRLTALAKASGHNVGAHTVRKFLRGDDGEDEGLWD